MTVSVSSYAPQYPEESLLRTAKAHAAQLFGELKLGPMALDTSDWREQQARHLAFCAVLVRAWQLSVFVCACGSPAGQRSGCNAEDVYRCQQ